MILKSWSSNKILIFFLVCLYNYQAVNLRAFRDFRVFIEPYADFYGWTKRWGSWQQSFVEKARNLDFPNINMEKLQNIPFSSYYI